MGSFQLQSTWDPPQLPLPARSPPSSAPMRITLPNTHTHPHPSSAGINNKHTQRPQPRAFPPPTRPLLLEAISRRISTPRLVRSHTAPNIFQVHRILCATIAILRIPHRRHQTSIMSSSTNSFLRGQRKTDLLELAEAVGFKKYVGPSCPSLAVLLSSPWPHLVAAPSHFLKCNVMESRMSSAFSSGRWACRGHRIAMRRRTTMRPPPRHARAPCKRTRVFAHHCMMGVIETRC